jgi:hypothetical protein
MVGEQHGDQVRGESGVFGDTGAQDVERPCGDGARVGADAGRRPCQGLVGGGDRASFEVRSAFPQGGIWVAERDEQVDEQVAQAVAVGVLRVAGQPSSRPVGGLGEPAGVLQGARDGPVAVGVVEVLGEDGDVMVDVAAGCGQLLAQVFGGPAAAPAVRVGVGSALDVRRLIAAVEAVLYGPSGGGGTGLRRPW